MAHQIIKQPNGNYSIFSSVTEEVIAYDYSEQQLIDLQTQWATESIIERIKSDTERRIRLIENGGKPYGRMTKTWNQVKKTIPKEWLDDDAIDIGSVIKQKPPVIQIRYTEPNGEPVLYENVNEYEFNNLRIYCLENKTTDCVEFLGLDGKWIKMDKNAKIDWMDWKQLPFNIIEKQLAELFKLSQQKKKNERK